MSRLQQPVSLRTLVFLGLALRLLALAFYWRLPLASDAADYCAVARRLVTEGHFVPYWPPGLPLLLTPVAALHLPDAFFRLPMLLFWGLLLWGIVRLGNDLGIARYVWLAVLLLGVYPDAVQLSVEPLTQLPAAAMLLLAASAGLRLCVAPDLHTTDLLLLAVSGAGLVLVRPSGALAVAFLYLLAATRVHRRVPLFASLLLAFVLLGGWLLYARHLCGRALLNTANAVNLWYGNNPSTPMYRTWFFGSHAKLGTAEAEQYPDFERVMARVSALPPLQQPAVFNHLATGYIASHPAAFLARSANRVRCFFGFDTFTSLNLRSSLPRLWPLVLLTEALLYLAAALPVAFWLAAASGAWWRTVPAALLTGAAVLYALPYWLSMSHPTYHFPVLAPLLLLGIAAWAGARGRLAPMQRLRGWVAVAVLLATQVEWVLRGKG